jgi:hypothetical protein
MKNTSTLFLIPVAGLLALSACKSTPEMTTRPDFLTTYNYLQKADPTTWRYVNPVLLGQCNKFIISPVKVLFKDIEGTPITPEQRQKTSDFVRQAMVSAISDRYPVVTEPGPDVGEIRIAITGAYRTGGRLGLCIQGEILDNSNTQVAAIVETELSELYSSDWQDKATAKAMVQNWGERLRKVLDDSRLK